MLSYYIQLQIWSDIFMLNTLHKYYLKFRIGKCLSFMSLTCNEKVLTLLLENTYPHWFWEIMYDKRYCWQNTGKLLPKLGVLVCSGLAVKDNGLINALDIVLDRLEALILAISCQKICCMKLAT